MPLIQTIGILTLGCRVNQYESDALAEGLTKAGFAIVPPTESPDLVIVNTCTVTGESDRKSRQMIRRAAAEGAMVIVTGCYAQVSPGDAMGIDGVVYVCGNGNKSEILSVVQKLAAGEAVEKSGVTDVMTAGYDPMERHIPRRYRSFIKIEDGCENRCAYCIIPAARGKVRSRPKEEILAEAAALASAGSHEVILTGIETASYGMDFHGENRTKYGMALASLLHEVSQVPGVERISLGSLEPAVMSAEFVAALREVRGLLPHFHLSIQSGSTSVLRRMRRRYTADMALAAMERLRQAIPEVTFSADIIVGFPGETEDEVRETADFIRQARFLHLHLFPYSKRAGTEAAAMAGQIPEETKKARLRELEEIQKALRLDMLNEYVEAHRNTPVYVLVEQSLMNQSLINQSLMNQRKSGIANGHTEHYVECDIPTDCELTGKTVPVFLTETDGKICRGVVPGCDQIL